MDSSQDNENRDCERAELHPADEAADEAPREWERFACFGVGRAEEMGG